MPDKTSIRIAIVDDSAFLRRGLGDCLSRVGYEVMEQARNPAGTMDQLAALSPDVLVIGPTFAEQEGLAICREVAARSTTIKTIVFTAHTDDPLFLADAVNAGASACLAVETTGEECLATVEAVLKGHQLFSREILSQDFKPIDLTPRELEVLKLSAHGKTLDQIANALVLQFSTVRTHHEHILEKLGVHSRQDAIRRARRTGLV